METGPASSEVVLEVSLLGSRGEALGRVTVPLMNQLLLPGGMGLFEADASSAPQASAVRVRVLSNVPSPREVEPLEASIVRSSWEAGPGAALLGQLTNPSDRTLRIEDLWVVGFDTSDQPRTLAAGVAAGDVLDPGESIPFLAEALDAVDVKRWEMLAQGSATGSSGASLVEAEEVELQADPQGNPFVTGVLVNPTDRPRNTRLFLLVTSDEDWLSAGAFEVPVALPPHAEWPFSIASLAGLPDRAQGVDLAPYVVDGPAEAGVVEVTAEVTGYEVIGSRLYLRGTLRTEGTDTLLRPTVFSLLRSSEGDLITGGWALAAERLEPGEVVPFLLTVPVPNGVDLALVEYDVQAFGATE